MDIGENGNQFELENRKLKREIKRLRRDNEVLRVANEQAAHTQAYIQRDNARQAFFNSQLLKTLPYILILTDDKLETVMVSDVFYKYDDVYDREKISRGVPLRAALIRMLDNVDLDILMVRCQLAMTGKTIPPYMIHCKFSGREVDWQVNIRYMLKDDKPVGLNILFYDMTQVMEALKKAEDADRAKSNFLANMSHEIRTPMNSINGMSEFIIRDTLDDKARHNAVMIKSASETLLSIINDILDFSKIESGKLEIIDTPFCIAEVVRDVATMTDIRLKGKEVTLILNIDEDIPCKLYGDEVRIRQVLLNILGNAAKFTNSGYIYLTIGCEKTSDDKCRLTVSVKDTGIGIKEEDKDRIFSSFTQVDTKKNRAVEGTGLGLAISKQLIEMMGGSISVESEYGRGTTFDFDIICGITDATPIGDIAEGFDDAESTVFEPTFTAEDVRVLIVDDNEMNLEVASGILEPYKIKVTKADSGFAAIEKFPEENFDIIFMDHMMPEMDGVDTMKKIRELKGGKDVLIIALTANVSAGIANEYREYGFDDYLGKPIEPKQMDSILKRYLATDRIDPIKKEEKAKRVPIVSAEPVVNAIKDEGAGPVSKTEDYVKTGDVALSSVNSPLIDKVVGMRYCMGKEDFYQKVMDIFLSSAKCDLIRQYFDEKNWEEYRVQVHSVKGTAMTIGAVSLSEKAKVIDSAVKAGNVPISESDHEAFMNEYEDVLKAIEESKS